ncbi:MAG: DUF4125 family protein [Eubacterium sp.]|nr:DUF4125 family protein [Eubacterium sp.]
MNDIINEILQIEWSMFDKVQNIGGRASCQDERQTFYIMRSSQLIAWPERMQESYLEDLKQAEREGRNPLSEKYGYMMERTSPAEYAGIRDQLPPRTPAKDAMIDRICEIQVAWQEDLAARFPGLTGRGRSIRRSEDSPFNTSFETYLWGELATYSEKTVRLYMEFVGQLQREGRNLPEMVLQNTTAQYGYRSLEEAEESLK